MASRSGWKPRAMTMLAEVVTQKTIKPVYGRKAHVPLGSIWIASLAIGADGRRIWECVACGKREQWSEGWRTYGSLVLQEEGVALPLCSEECQRAWEAS